MDIIAFFTSLGYVGIFLISFIGSLSVVIPVPYTVAYYLLGITMDPLYIAAAGGLGSALGEIGGYTLGYFGQTLINEKYKKRMSYFVKIFDHYGPIVVFIFALTPLPDDLLFIPLGILRYNFVKVFIPCFVGKIIMAYIVAYSGKASFQFIRTIFGDSGWVAAILTLILLVISLIVILRVDWEAIFNKYIEKKK